MNEQKIKERKSATTLVLTTGTYLIMVQSVSLLALGKEERILEVLLKYFRKSSYLNVQLVSGLFVVRA